MPGSTSRCSPDNRGPGRVTIRRLNRTEYNNTIRDLIGLDLRPADEFPADDVGYGFDNIGDVLATPPILLEMYLAAAETVIGEAFRTPEARERLMNPPADTIPLASGSTSRRSGLRAKDKIVPVRYRPLQTPSWRGSSTSTTSCVAFADRAFRRPATHDELTRLLGIVLSAEKDGEESESALQLALQAVLVSPHFLFLRLEHGSRPGLDERSVPINDFDLASRLSYFLWSSMPDETAP